MKKTAKAYAKINLYLDIVGKRENGYHDICGVMQKISLCDTVTVSLLPSEQNVIQITCSDPRIPTDSKNIAYKAASAYLDSFSESTYKVMIDIQKHIPAAGGLAGGSTDAAAVLKLMQELTDQPESVDTLIPIASKLGADVPFTLSCGSMITEGIGDVLTPISSLEDCYVLITNTGERVSTPAAYARLDLLYDNFKKPELNRSRFESLCDGLKEKNTRKTAQFMYNIFEDAVLKECTLAAEAKRLISDCGALGAMMSGSGPTVFGIFDDTDKVKLAYKKLCELGYDTHICTPIK